MTPPRKTLIAFATQWGTKFGGINCFNIDLVKAVASTFFDRVKSVCVVLEATSEQIEEALNDGVVLLELNKQHQEKFSPDLVDAVLRLLEKASIRLDPAETVWLGHDRITGAIALAAAEKFGGKSALIHHMSYVHYEPFEEDSASARVKENEQRVLFLKADFVLAIGPLLRDALIDLIEKTNVSMLVPGLPNIQPRSEPKNFKAFLSGRLAAKIKQASLGLAAFGAAVNQCTKNPGLPSQLNLNQEPRMILRGVDFERVSDDAETQAELEIKKFVEGYANGAVNIQTLPFTTDRFELFKDLRSSSVAMMPSWHEGFGLVAWEAIAAGVPLILTKKSGAYHLITEVDDGIYTSTVTSIEVAGSYTEPYFQAQDLNTLTAALIQIAKEQDQHRSKAHRLRERLLALYSWGHCASQLCSALNWEFDASQQPPTALLDVPNNLNKFLERDHDKNARPVQQPQVNLLQLRESLKRTSSIGRSWRRDIGGHQFASPVVNRILEAVNNKVRSILITGSPGAGKTCVMLSLQEQLEQRAQTCDVLPIFIQSREFADTITPQERQSQGLPDDWVESVELLAEHTYVVVVIDSLDVLSIAREHRVLAYFLAQIDRLLLMSNVTIVTACRDFDRYYDRRIAQRSWDKEFACQPLDWANEIAPLLLKHGIDASVTDVATRELIRNPRELAMFVELAQQNGSFNVVTSQALAQRYLSMIVKADADLGDAAMQAIEALAAEMLNRRSLAVPHQRFSSSPNMQRALLSHKVLHETQGGLLSFGHQTLLDVLVISGALRQGVTLNAFIQGLPPVPFVRPSIRSFVAQLASGDLREFRKQLRTVLTSAHAFHVRRLVAECLAEQIPQDEDWPLIRDLRNQHPEVFQVIYTRAVRLEWHYFWMKHLVPLLKDVRDSNGLITHVHITSQWQEDAADEILSFWMDVLAIDWLDKRQIAWQLEIALSGIKENQSALIAPLVLALLDLPRQTHSAIGRVLAQCIRVGAVEDTVLWQYVAGEVGDDDVMSYRFDKKLHCQPHEFGNSHDKFFANRMQQSTTLLDLAVNAIERWSLLKASRYGETPKVYWSGFLDETSFDGPQKNNDYRFLDSERILMDAVELAVVHHASTQSEWWQINRQRLCFNVDGALRYFAILACRSAPTANLDVIGRMLCNKELLESDLSHEIGALMQLVFYQFDSTTQDSILESILATYQEVATDSKYSEWILRKQAQLILPIPRYLRSKEAQTVIDECEKITWPLVSLTNAGLRGGIIAAPFSYEVFLNSSDVSVLQLLKHYNGYARNSFDDFLMGGEGEVGTQLSEAASRNPIRFINFLSMMSEDIPSRFRDYIMDGLATYLAHRYGNLRANGDWKPNEEVNAIALAQKILDELEGHQSYWMHNYAASNAIQGCSYVIEHTHEAERLTSLAMAFSTLEEKSSISGDSVDLLTIGINMARGKAAESLMIVAEQLEKYSMSWPDVLSVALRLFASDKDPAVRAMLLRRLPYFQNHHPDLGWELFGLAMQVRVEGLWTIAEPCLYHAYLKKFELVAPWLTQLYSEGQEKDFETWGRISALAALTNQLDFSVFLQKIKTVETANAWRGAASVWTHPDNMRQFREQCLEGLEAGLNVENQYAPVIARKFRSLFRETTPLISIPINLLKRCFALLEIEPESARGDIYGFDAWLNATSLQDPVTALESTEMYLGFVQRTKPYVYDHENNLTQLLTRLFAQAEEVEELDGGSMLQRVVAIQDTLLALGVNGVNEWLKVAERP
jgi:glycosyltransferase involved in cell wall biosynthesis